jgi:hypothetical protein
MPAAHVLVRSVRQPVAERPDYGVPDVFAVVFCATLSAKETRNCGIDRRCNQGQEGWYQIELIDQCAVRTHS